MCLHSRVYYLHIELLRNILIYKRVCLYVRACMYRVESIVFIRYARLSNTNLLFRYLLQDTFRKRDKKQVSLFFLKTIFKIIFNPLRFNYIYHKSIFGGVLIAFRVPFSVVCHFLIFPATTSRVMTIRSAMFTRSGENIEREKKHGCHILNVARMIRHLTTQCYRNSVKYYSKYIRKIYLKKQLVYWRIYDVTICDNYHCIRE